MTFQNQFHPHLTFIVSKVKTIFIQFILNNINNKMQSSQNLPTDKNQSYCKNHPQIQSEYFLTQQPSIRYCKNCALNVALCGRKIEKELTPEAQKRKSQINSVVSQLKKGIQTISMSQNFIQEAQRHYEQMGRPFQQRINELQKSIAQLTSLRQLLCNKYEQKILRKVESLKNDRQKATQKKVQTQKLIEKIESNFGNLIEMDMGKQLSTQITKWNEIILKNAENLIQENIFEQMKQNLVLDIHQMFQLCEKICQFRVHMPETNYKVLIPLDQNKENYIPFLEFNNLESSRLVEQLKINLTANAVKNKTVKKKTNERYQPPSSRRSNLH